MDRIRAAIWATLGIGLSTPSAAAQSSPGDSAAPYALITARGRLLAAYDQASWHASDSISKRPMPTTGTGLWVAHQDAEGWTVSFGAINFERTSFLVSYRAFPTADPKQFRIEQYETPVSAPDSELRAARALALSIDDFGPLKRRYNLAVLPADSGAFWVYLYPAPYRAGYWPHGGDVRYLISPDGRTIRERRNLHRSILEMGPPPATAKFGMHTAILDTLPEDTDVLYVLTRQPAMEEQVMTDRYRYYIHFDGSITRHDRAGKPGAPALP